MFQSVGLGFGCTSESESVNRVWVEKYYKWMDKKRVWEMKSIFRLNSEDFSKFFLSLDILFLTSSYERTHEKVQKNAKNFSDYSWIFMIFRFLEVFRTKLFCTVRYSHVLTIIRFPVKFHIGLYLSDHGGRRGKNGFIAKTVQKCDFTRVKTA